MVCRCFASHECEANEPRRCPPSSYRRPIKESNDSAHIEEQDLKDDGVVIAQLVPISPIASLVSFVEDSSTQNIVDPTTMDPSPS
nr:hypothetical protein CFP56_36089 [Quercus suber]